MAGEAFTVKGYGVVVIRDGSARLASQPRAAFFPALAPVRIRMTRQ